MKTKYLITILGLITVLYWAAYIPSLYPAPFIDTQSQAENLGNNTGDELDDFIKKENIKTWFITLALVVGGVVAGILILCKVKVARPLAILFSLIVLIYMVWYYSNGAAFTVLKTMFRHDPLLVFRHEILRTLICLATIILLLMPSFRTQFNKHKTEQSA